MGGVGEYYVCVHTCTDSSGADAVSIITNAFDSVIVLVHCVCVCVSYHYW